MHGRNRTRGVRARSRPNGALKYHATLGPEHTRSHGIFSARSSRERQPTVGPGALLPPLRQEQRHQPSVGGGPSLDPRNFRSRISAKNEWAVQSLKKMN